MPLLGAMDAGHAGRFSLRDNLTAARIAGDVLQLVLLDAVWTDAAQRNKREEVGDLGAIVDQMDTLLARLTEDTTRVFEILQNVGEEDAEAVLSHPRLAGGELTGRLRARAARDGGVLAMIRKGLQRAGDTFYNERAQLKREFERIRKGHESVGDLDSLTHCGLGLIEMGLGLGPGGLPLFVDGVERVVEHCAG